MKIKTCNNCGNQVSDNSNYCQKCGGSTFTQNVPVKQSNPSLVHRLLYWEYDGGYVLAKSKLLGIASFLVMTLTVPFTNIPGMIVVALILSLLIFLIAYIAHKILPGPSEAKLTHNDYNPVIDLIHLIFYWQNKNTGEFVVSKTKCITFVIFILFTAFAMFNLFAPSLFAAILFSSFFSLIAFLLGYGIHKLTNPNPTRPVREIHEVEKVSEVKEEPETGMDIVPEYLEYKNHIEELKNDFDSKAADTRDLIEKRFEPPQLTYTRFIGVVDKSSDVFNHQFESAMNMINLAGEYSAKIDNELKSKIKILTSIIDKLEDLESELVVTMDDANEDEVNNLFDEMSDLVKSVKDYE